MRQQPSRHHHVACIRCRAPLSVGEAVCGRCTKSTAADELSGDPFERHLNAERKRKVTVVLSTLFAIWYVLLLAKPMLAQRPDVELCFVLFAPIAIGLWFWRKPVSRVYRTMEVRLEALDVQNMLIAAMSAPNAKHSFNLAIAREPDFLSCVYKHTSPDCKGTLTISLHEGEEFTTLSWSLHFDGRVTSDDAHFFQHELDEWLHTVLASWM